MKQSVKIALLVAVPLAVAGAVLIYNHLSTKPSQPSSEQSAPRGGRGGGVRKIPVDVYVVDYLRLSEGKNVTAVLLANEELDVASEVAGKIEKIYFEEGSKVRQGDVLAKINDDDLQSQLRRATYQRNMLKEKLERARVLLDKDAVSRESFDQVETDYNMVEADIQLLEVRIGKTSIKAPFDGTVGFRYVSPGSYIQPGTRITHMVDNSKLKVELSIAERFYSESFKGTQVEFTAESDPKPRYATIYAVDPQVVDITRMVVMRAMYNNADMKLVPGMFVKAVVGQKTGQTLQVPTEAIVPDAQDKKVWVVREGKAHLQSVVTGVRSQDKIEITRGLSPGDSVAVTGLMQLKEGADVIVNN